MVDTLGVSKPDWVQQLVSEWKPRERLGGDAWAERFRVLSREESPSPGPWRSVPWQREILDAFADPSLDWIVILKAAQMGVSDLVRNAIGRWAQLDPGDVLWVMTTEQAAKKAMKKLRAMFRSTPALRGLLSDRRTDSTLLELVLTNGMRIVIGWAGSAQSLASDPFRYVILDEVAKYRWAVQGEGSPVDLAKERTKVYGRRAKVILLSSPKGEDDLIVTHHGEVLDRRVFSVPCEDCGKAQPVDFLSVRWPLGEPGTAPVDPLERARLADLLDERQSAWVECAFCRGRVLPHRSMWAKGAGWTQEKPAETSRRRAYHVPEFFHWETTISGLAAKWLRCTTPSARQGFHNGSLGLPYKNERGALPANLFQRRAIHPDGVVPAWATAVLSTADTQADHFWFKVQAWAPGGRTRNLDWGRVDSFADLRARCLDRRFAVEGGGTAAPRFLLIDSGGGMETPDGSRTHDVYQFALTTPHVFACKGEADLEVYKGSPFRRSKVTYAPPGGRAAAYEIELVLLHVEYWKDTTAALIRSEQWEECQSAAAPEYGRQMTAEHKVMTAEPSGKTYWRWTKRAKHGQEHLWDCSWMQPAAAAIAQLDGEAPIPERIQARKKKASQPKREPKRARMPDGRPYHVGRR